MRHDTSLQIGMAEYIFGRCGVNGLYALKGIRKNGDMLVESCTDWVGPVVVRADGCDEEAWWAFTGGWHGSNGDGTGEPTAHTVNVDACAGLLIVKNDIKACNSLHAAAVLRETVRYSAVDGKLEVAVELQALVGCRILRYYGLQSQNTAWRGAVLYDGERGGGSFEESCAKSAATGRKITVCSKDSLHRLEMMLYPQDLGLFEYKAANLPWGFTMEYGKSYFNLVNGTELHLAKNEHVFWRGSYEVD